MGLDTHMGELYPFTLADKLAAITEPSPWYHDASPWGGPVIPTEMVSVLALATSRQAGFEVRQPSVGLFIDLEVRMLAGPLFVAGRIGSTARSSRCPRAVAPSPAGR